MFFVGLINSFGMKVQDKKHGYKFIWMILLLFMCSFFDS